MNNREKVITNVRYNNARQRAREAGVPFDLCKEDIVVPDECPICKTSLRISEFGSGSQSSSPSVDRIIPELGYTKENVVVICHGCNRKKDNMSPEEMYRIADYVYRLRKVRGLC